MNPAPPKPPSKNADRKAWSAFYSELRRWENALKEWEADLDSREAALEQAIDAAPDETVQRYAGVVQASQADGWVDVDEDDDDCGCTTDDAMEGCTCPPCEAWRKSQVKPGTNYFKDDHTQHVKTRDEIQWLEALWKLEDKRK